MSILLTGCTPFGWGRATPTPVTEDAALQRFLASAPAPLRDVATPTPDDSGARVTPRGLPLPLVEPLNVEGDVAITGSPALAPLTRLLYASFVSAGYRDTMKIEEVGSDAGFQHYCTHDLTDSAAADLVMADRPMRQSELELCLQHDRKPVALRVALNAVAVVSNVDAVAVTSVNKKELATLFTARHWSDVERSWPAVDIVRVAPAADNIAFALVVEKILNRNALLLQNAPATTFLEDGQEIAITIADTPAAVGFLNYADYQKNASELRLLAIDGIQPDSATVSSGVYPFTYPLLLYADDTTLHVKGQVAAFLLYYLANMNAVMAEAGNFPVNEAIYERTKVVLLTALGQEAYLEQFPPTSTPAPPPTITPMPTMTSTAVLTATGTVTVTR
ncbi:MAG: substrate-binding domain-containing protein [Caldilineaceae bacterium]